MSTLVARQTPDFSAVALMPHIKSDDLNKTDKF